jgi:RNA polymerase sigma-70 factor (ECF subfamily)
MAPDLSFDNLMAGLRRGDSEAAERLFGRFTHRLVALARGRLDARLRQKVDPEDVVQSVWKSFFPRQAQGQYDLKDWDDLWALLTVITVRKCGRWRERFRTRARDVAREETTCDFFDREPAPEEALLLAETLEQAMRGLEKPHCDMVLMRLQGDSVAEIGRALGFTRRTVQRVLREVRCRLERMQAQT